MYDNETHMAPLDKFVYKNQVYSKQFKDPLQDGIIFKFIKKYRLQRKIFLEM